MEREFNRLTDCVSCKRYIDEVTVKLKKLTTAGDTYRVPNATTDPRFKWEKLCVECFYGRKVS